jgi:hypothetical protein
VGVTATSSLAERFAQRRVSLTCLALSIACYTVSMFLPTFSTDFDSPPGSGFVLLVLGWVELGAWARAGWLAALAWCANPTLLIAWGAIVSRERWAPTPAIWALVLSLGFRFAEHVFDRGVQLDVVAWHSGYWVWVASAAVACVGAASVARSWAHVTVPGERRQVPWLVVSVSTFLIGGFITATDDVLGRHGEYEISLLAGSTTTSPGYKNLAGLPSGLQMIESMALDPQGGLFLFDGGTVHIAPSGDVTPLLNAGTGEFAFDAQKRMWRLGPVRPYPLRMALFRVDDAGHGQEQNVQWPSGDNTFSDLQVDENGRVFMVHWHGDEIVTVEEDGRIRTIAGSGKPGFHDGNGAAAAFDAPSLLGFDPTGALLVCDRHNSALRRVTVSGETSTVAGLGSLDSLSDCALGPGGDLYLVRYLAKRGISELYRAVPPNFMPALVSEVPRRLGALVVAPDGTLYASMLHTGRQEPAGVLKLAPMQRRRD